MYFSCMQIANLDLAEYSVKLYIRRRNSIGLVSQFFYGLIMIVIHVDITAGNRVIVINRLYM